MVILKALSYSRNTTCETCGLFLSRLHAAFSFCNVLHAENVLCFGVPEEHEKVKNVFNYYYGLMRYKNRCFLLAIHLSKNLRCNKWCKPKRHKMSVENTSKNHFYLLKVDFVQKPTDLLKAHVISASVRLFR